MVNIPNPGRTDWETGRTSAKLASHRRPPRGDLLVPWVEDGVLLLLLLLLLLVVVHLGRESEKEGGSEQTDPDLLRAHHEWLRSGGGN